MGRNYHCKTPKDRVCTGSEGQGAAQKATALLRAVMAEIEVAIFAFDTAARSPTGWASPSSNPTEPGRAVHSLDLIYYEVVFVATG